MSSKEVSKLKRLKGELKKTLNKVKTSDRFLMLRLLRLSHFMSNGSFGNPHLDELTLEDLIEQGGDLLFEEDRVESGVIKELIEILNNFLKEDSTTSTLELLDDAPPTLDDEEGEVPQEDETIKESILSLSTRSIRQKSSIEAEKILLKAYEDLQQAKCFEQIKNNKLARYWDTSRVRDLFLEDLSFHQLLTIKVEYLLEKHSFTKTKLEAIVDAIYKCIKDNSDEIELKDRDQSSCSNKDGDVESVFTYKNDFVWRDEHVCDAEISDAILSQFIIARSIAQRQNKWIAKIITSFPNILNAREYVIWWCEAVYGFELSSILLNIPRINLLNEYKLCSEAIKTMLPDIASVFYTHWQGALSGVGASYSWLVNPYISDLLSENFQKVFFKGMLHSFGAVNVSAFGVVIPDYWTTNPSLLEIILDGLIKEKKLTKNSKEQVIKKVLPLIPYKDIKPIIEEIKL